MPFADTAKRAAYNKKWRESNKEKMALLKSDWRKRNPEKVKAAREGRLEVMRAETNNKLHGSLTGYGYGCRCEPCRAAGSAYQGVARDQRRPRRTISGPISGPDDPRHGTSGGYTNHKCRCSACLAAKAEQMRNYRAKKREQKRA